MKVKELLPELPFAYDSNKIVAWHLFIFVLITYEVIVLPVHLFWQETDSVSNIETIVDIVVDICFFCDVMVQFGTEYKRHGVFINRLSSIRRTYFKTNFFGDAIPLLGSAAWIIGKSMFRVFRITKLFRVFKLFRLFRMFQVWDHLRSKISHRFSLLLKTIIVIFISWHWVSCLYWYIARIDGFCNWEADGDPFWGDNDLAPNGFVECQDDFSPWIKILDEPWYTQYLHSFVWSVTVTTGLDSSLPHSNVEGVFGLILMIGGVAMYGFLISVLTQTLLEPDIDEVRERQLNRLLGILYSLRQAAETGGPALNSTLRGLCSREFSSRALLNLDDGATEDGSFLRLQGLTVPKNQWPLIEEYVSVLFPNQQRYVLNHVSDIVAADADVSPSRHFKICVELGRRFFDRTLLVVNPLSLNFRERIHWREAVYQVWRSLHSHVALAGEILTDVSVDLKVNPETPVVFFIREGEVVRIADPVMFDESDSESDEQKSEDEKNSYPPKMLPSDSSRSVFPRVMRPGTALRPLSELEISRFYYQGEGFGLEALHGRYRYHKHIYVSRGTSDLLTLSYKAYNLVCSRIRQFRRWTTIHVSGGGRRRSSTAGIGRVAAVDCPPGVRGSFTPPPTPDNATNINSTSFSSSIHNSTSHTSVSMRHTLTGSMVENSNVIRKMNHNQSPKSAKSVPTESNVNLNSIAGNGLSPPKSAPQKLNPDELFRQYSDDSLKSTAEIMTHTGYTDRSDRSDRSGGSHGQTIINSSVGQAKLHMINNNNNNNNNNNSSENHMSDSDSDDSINQRSSEGEGDGDEGTTNKTNGKSTNNPTITTTSTPVNFSLGSLRTGTLKSKNDSSSAVSGSSSSMRAITHEGANFGDARSRRSLLKAQQSQRTRIIGEDNSKRRFSVFKPRRLNTVLFTDMDAKK
eukprot:TRINITY_DN2791_c0_g7_i1.p1 TRINITY_DN2791_c0_g7~~TRINITY_DN2791_c0_g7_i1.p1  ORF type:complete len:914 (+),score=192.47 TRINITY_DN2791_c0_g7_i1:133-2874(+)